MKYYMKNGESKITMSDLGIFIMTLSYIKVTFLLQICLYFKEIVFYKKRYNSVTFKAETLFVSFEDYRGHAVHCCILISEQVWKALLE